MTKERFESEPMISKHSKWLAKEAKEFGKSAIMGTIALVAGNELIKFVYPEWASQSMDPAVWGAVVGTDYMRRKLTRGGN